MWEYEDSCVQCECVWRARGSPGEDPSMRACLSVHARATVTRVCPGVSMKVVAFVARPLRPYERADPFFCKTVSQAKPTTRRVKHPSFGGASHF